VVESNRKGESIKMLVFYHKSSIILRDEITVPIHCGRANYLDCFKRGEISKDDYDFMMENTIGDNTGDNISQLNKDFCELTGIYWAWKNYDKLGNPDRIGFMHYHRHFVFDSIKNFNNKYKNVMIRFDRLDDNTLRAIKYSPKIVNETVSQYDFIAASPVDDGVTVYEHFDKYHNVEEVTFCLNIVKQRYKKIYSYAEQFFNQNLNSCCNMFIMKRDIFFEYCKFVFDIAFDFIKNFDRYNYSFKDRRLFIIERMTALYLYYLSKQDTIKHHYLPISFIKHPDVVLNPKPAFEVNNIPLVFVSDRDYSKIAAIAIQSIIENSKEINNYDIFIVGKEIWNENKRRISNMISGLKNFSVRFVDMNYFLANTDVDKSLICNTSRFSKGGTYYRLWIPKIFKNYGKILYLDSDIVVLRDIADLYAEDIGDNIIGAAHDIEYIRIAYKKHKSSNFINKYSRGVLKISPYDYIQAGVILFNITLAQKEDFFEKSFDFLAKNPNPYNNDQDVLNFVCKGSIKYLPVNWNVEWHCVFFYEDSPLYQSLPAKFYTEYMEARKNPYILHYSSNFKPWSMPMLPLAEIFWQYVHNSPYNETMLLELIRVSMEQQRKHKKKWKFFTTLICAFIPSCNIRRRIRAAIARKQKKIEFDGLFGIERVIKNGTN
jgi:lipopolysaccharide biosynthesis glycosyltransferase